MIKPSIVTRGPQFIRYRYHKDSQCRADDFSRAQPKWVYRESGTRVDSPYRPRCCAPPSSSPSSRRSLAATGQCHSRARGTLSTARSPRGPSGPIPATPRTRAPTARSRFARMARTAKARARSRPTAACGTSSVRSTGNRATGSRTGENTVVQRRRGAREVEKRAGLREGGGER